MACIVKLLVTIHVVKLLKEPQNHLGSHFNFFDRALLFEASKGYQGLSGHLDGRYSGDRCSSHDGDQSLA